MAFKPETLDGQKAAAKLLAKRRNKPLSCLYEVFHAFPFKRSDRPGQYNSARLSWNYTPKNRRHEGDRNVPAGAVVYFKLRIEEGTVDPWPGHICLSLGGNRIVTTDFPERGTISVTTIEELERRWAGNQVEYLGWTDWIGGHNVTVGARPGQGTGASTGGKRPGEVYVVTSPTYLRRLAKTGKATQIKRLKVGQRLRIIAITKTWATVLRGDNTLAYVWAARLTKEHLRAAQNTRLRAEPTVNSALVRHVAKGKKVKVIGRRVGGRVLVKFGSSTGWALRKHLR